MFLAKFLLFYTVSSELSDQTLSLLTTQYSPINPSDPPFTLFEEIYKNPFPTNYTETLILSNSTDSHTLSLHYFKLLSPLPHLKILENSSPIFQSIPNVTISDIEKLYKLNLKHRFKELKIIQAQVQKIPQFERRFSLVGIFYIADGNIYNFYAVLDKNNMIKSYSWALSSNTIKFIETSSVPWEIFSFIVSSLICLASIYLFWAKTKKFPFNGMLETQVKEGEIV